MPNIDSIMKTKIKKILPYIISILFIVIIVLYKRRKYNTLITDSQIVMVNTIPKSHDQLNYKHILLWTSNATEPFTFFGVGQKLFTDRKCPHSNCIITSDRSYLGDYTQFDAIAFHGPEVLRARQSQLPIRRSPHQKYIFTCIESSDYYPACTNKFDGFFNWTWTYKLNSDVTWRYLTVKDRTNKVIGPNMEMHWMRIEDMDPLTEGFKKKLRFKTKAAAWFVSNCNSLSHREIVVRELQTELIKYNLTVDVYGGCGHYRCSRSNEDECDQIVKEKYYFYLAFENSMSEDYVTEKLFRPLEFNTVPIVYGAANYTRFMPDGIYLNAKKLGVTALAKKMYELIHSPEEYADYFKWINHYFYNIFQSVYTQEYCNICTILNDDSKVEEMSVYYNFDQWWNPPGRC